MVYPTLVSFPLHENECLHILLAKTEPWWLGLGFWPQLGPPSCITQSLAPTTLNTVYSTPIGPPLPENKCPHIVLAKTEPRRLGFGFWLQLSPPSRIARSHHPTTSNPVYSCQIGFYLPENDPSTLCWNLALTHTHTPCALPDPTTTSNPVNPTQIRSPVPEN